MSLSISWKLKKNRSQLLYQSKNFLIIAFLTLYKNKEKRMKFDKDFCRFLYFLLRAFSSAFFLKRKMSSEQIFFFFVKIHIQQCKDGTTKHQNCREFENKKRTFEQKTSLINHTHTPGIVNRLSPRLGSKHFHV